MDQLLKSKCQAKTVEEFLSRDNLTACLKVRAAFHISQVMASIRELGVEQKVWMNELISIDFEKDDPRPPNFPDVPVQRPGH